MPGFSYQLVDTQASSVQHGDEDPQNVSSQNDVWSDGDPYEDVSICSRACTSFCKTCDLILPRIGTCCSYVSACWTYAINLRWRERITLVALLMWILIGLRVYWRHHIDNQVQYMTLVDTLYVMAQIITTIGYGDVCPAPILGFFLTAVYLLVGVVVLSSVVSALAERVILTDSSIVQTYLKELNFEEQIPGIRVAQDYIPDRAHGYLSELCQCLLSCFRWTCGSLASSSSQEMDSFRSACGIWCICVAVGMLFFMLCPGEMMGIEKAFYFSIMTLTTVGFGDVVPQTQFGRLFATVWMLLGTGAFANMVAKFSVMLMESHLRLRNLDIQQVFKDFLEDDLYKKCSARNTDLKPQVTRAEFILITMKQMGVLDDGIVAQLNAKFEQLDKDNTNVLEQDAIFTLEQTLAAEKRLGTRRQSTEPILGAARNPFVRNLIRYATAPPQWTTDG